MKFQGVYPALLTPFHEDGSIDFSSLEKHTDFLVSKGVHGLFPLGTTGEGLLLSTEERKQVAEHVIKAVDGRIPVVIHVGELSTEVTMELAQHAEKVGASGISVICPYFFPLDDEAIYQHFARISQAVSSDFPVFVYNFPGNARNEITLSVLLKLIENCRNFKALKFSSDNFTQILRILDAVEPDFSVMLGPDQYYLAGLHMGTSGNVSGNANIFPEPYVALFEQFQKGEYEQARKTQQQINHISETLQHGLNLSLYKQALAFRGLPTSYVRSPLLNLSEEEKNVLLEKLEQIHV